MHTHFESANALNFFVPLKFTVKDTTPSNCLIDNTIKLQDFSYNEHRKKNQSKMNSILRNLGRITNSKFDAINHVLPSIPSALNALYIPHLIFTPLSVDL